VCLLVGVSSSECEPMNGWSHDTAARVSVSECVLLQVGANQQAGGRLRASSSECEKVSASDFEQVLTSSRV